MARRTQKRPARRSRSPKRVPGTPPGTLVSDPEAAPPVIRVIAYGPDDVLEQQVEDLESVPALLGRWPVVWLNVDGLGHAGTMARLGELFHLHGLALEDVLHVRQRPKVDQYGEQLFVVTRMVSLGQTLETEQISLFLGDGFVLTFQERPGDCLDPVRQRIRKGLGRIRTRGCDYLLYSLLDAVIDNFFPILEQLGERLEALEDRVIESPDAAAVARIHQIKRDMLALRRAIWPQRDAINWLLREPLPAITDDTRLYLRDCYDHVSQIIDMVETCRELASGLVEMHMSSVSNRMNEVMKVLTIIATIFIPLSFLAGLYGMNFSPEKSPLNMPELHWYWGYPFALTVMGIVALGMLGFFWRRGWLGPSRLPEKDRRARGGPAGPAEA